MKSATTPNPPKTDHSAFWAVAEGRTHDPHSILGAHLFTTNGAAWAVIRALRPLADEVTIITTDGETPAVHAAAGVWEAVVPALVDDKGAHTPDYRVRQRYGDDVQTMDDPYRFLPSLGELDLHLIREGRHEELWKVLGANLHTYPSPLGDAHGVNFAVWAPNAQAVRLIGSFNRWTPIHLMRSLGSSGIWELFLPGAKPGDLYKYEIKGPDGNWHSKADPLAKGAEVPPNTASVVVESRYEWNDADWIAKRVATNPHNGPVSVYEVHLGSWRLGKTYRELADELTEYVAGLGFTHVEFMPVAEHPYAPSWGYQVTGYYAPTSRFGHPDDLRYLIDRLHQAGIGVIMDWVPAHFPKDDFALARFDGTPLYEHSDPRRGEHPDWGTYIFDFGRTEVRNFLVANATYWFEEFHVDALRVDAVASMLYLDYSRKDGEWYPNQYGGRENLDAISFIQEANATAYRRTPGVMMMAEESTAYPGVTAPTSHNGLGFGLKWNMGWMNDSLRYIEKDPMYRSWHHGELTFSLIYAFSEQYILPISHDEVVHGKGSLLRKMPGDRWQQLANVRAFLTYMWTHPGKQLLFMGSEFAMDSEWTEEHGLDWWLLDYAPHQQMQRLVRDLNAVYKANPALWERDFTPDGFEWIDANDGDHNTLCYLRKGLDGKSVIVVVNFSGMAYEGYRLALPGDGVWREIMNSDDQAYGGSGVTNPNGVHAEPVPWHGRSHSGLLRVPPLGATILTQG